MDGSPIYRKKPAYLLTNNRLLGSRASTTGHAFGGARFPMDRNPRPTFSLCLRPNLTVSLFISKTNSQLEIFLSSKLLDIGAERYSRLTPQVGSAMLTLKRFF